MSAQKADQESQRHPDHPGQSGTTAAGPADSLVADLPISRGELLAEVKRLSARLAELEAGGEPGGSRSASPGEDFQLIADNAPDIIYALDLDGAFTYVNPAWQRILGHSPEEVRGRFFTDFAPKEEARSLIRVFKKIRDRKETIHAQRPLLHQDGSQRHFSMSGSPNLDEQGTVIGIVGTLRDTTQHRDTLEALRRSESSLAHAQRMAHLGNWELELATGKAACSEEVFNIYGLEPTPDRTVTLDDFIRAVHREDRDAVERAVRRATEERGEINIEHRIVRPDHVVRVVHELGEVEADEAGTPVRVVGAVQDITERRRSEAHMHLLARVFESTIEGIMVTDAAGVIQMVNRAFASITGYSAEEAIGSKPSLLSSKQHDEKFYEAMWSALTSEGQWQGEIWNRRKDGEAYPEWLTITALKGGDGATTHYVGVFHDISKLKRNEEQITHQAYHDALTGLPNRALFNDRLRVALAGARRNMDRLSVLFLDLDNFKQTNDSLGHAAGDILLQGVTKRLLTCLREEDTVARIGGDEFLILLPGTTDKTFAGQVAQRILESLAEPFMVKDHELHVTASIGLTLYPDDGQDLETLVANADMAMYKAKEAGRNRSKHFTRSMNYRVKLRLSMESKLRRAIERDELRLHYQPVVDLESGKVCGLEALLRWQWPGSDLIFPEELIPLAEETGLIVPIGEWVLYSACEQIRQWNAAGFAPLDVAVNISARQLRENDIAKTVTDALQKSELPVARLQLELTEGAIRRCTGEEGRMVSQLVRLGLRLTMDDFGRGNSSLYFLKRFPISTIKIDRLFIADLSREMSDASIVETIITMGRTLNLKVVAKGVEREEQLLFLKEHGCDQIQGNFFARPLPPEEVTRLLESGAGLE